MILLSVPFSASAANGDIVGEIYSTDIRAYINGVEVESYNIGGKTAVVVEDILSEASHPYIYNDEYRTLKFFTLAPNYLVEGKNESTKKPGTVVGKIYETDIKTSIYDVILPTYNIGGKTAVAIESLGSDGVFSPIGGKYIWNGKERTISLEFLYDNSNVIPTDKNITVSSNESMTEANAVFEEVLHCGGGNEHFNWPSYVTDDTDIEVVLPIKVQNEIIGYYFRRPSKDYKFTAFTYYYPEKVKETANIYTPYLWKTKENIISHFVTRHSGNAPREQFDTENYSFVWLSTGFVGGSADYLVQVYNNGDYKDYMEEIKNGYRKIVDFNLDRENERLLLSMLIGKLLIGLQITKLI